MCQVTSFYPLMRCLFLVFGLWTASGVYGQLNQVGTAMPVLKDTQAYSPLFPPYAYRLLLQEASEKQWPGKNNTRKPRPFKQPTTDDRIFIDFVGTGDIQKTISEGGDINANTGLGIVYERVNKETDHFFQSIELDALINIFTTADTLVSDFGANGDMTNRRSFASYLLNPVSARQATYINANYYFGYPKKSGSYTRFARIANYVSGVNARFIASNNIWKYNEDTVRNLGALYARLGVFHEILPDNHRIDDVTGRSKYSCFIGVNYSFRGLFGDLSSDANARIREQFLGSAQRTFGGLELNFGFRLNNLRAEFQMPILSDRKGTIEGLTNTQFLFSIKFVGGFGLKLNTNARGEEVKSEEAPQQ